MNAAKTYKYAHPTLWVEVHLSVLQALLPTALQGFCHRLGKVDIR